MNVLQVNKFYHPVVGGIEQVVRQLAEGFVEGGHDVRVLAARERGFRGRNELAGVDVRRASTADTILSTPLAPGFPALVKKHSEWADIVHYHLPNPLAVVSHLLARPAAETVVTYHSDIVRQSQSLKLYRPLLQWVLDDVDRILTTSPRLKESSSFLAARQEKTSVVPLSVDIGEIHSRGVAPPFPTDRLTVLFVGRLNYYKGVEYLIQAITQIESDAQLVLVGDGNRRSGLERTVNAESLEGDIRFLGAVSDDVLSACYDAADVFVLPSVEPSEAFGIVQLEAMAHSVPVINTSLPTGVPWVSIDGQTGLTVPPKEPKPLAAAIDRLVSSPELREIYGRNARERVEAKFTKDRMISDTLNVYRELLG